jgi:hypothetical protein
MVDDTDAQALASSRMEGAGAKPEVGKEEEIRDHQPAHTWSSSPRA